MAKKPDARPDPDPFVVDPVRPIEEDYPDTKMPGEDVVAFNERVKNRKKK